ncbi:MAG TPA: PhnD/SsuA/transferrin family substrate-binding protein [Rhizobiales bacterium]|nr:PhnD/SsuA/transferrin family substrate-binding protein [Hyphomicrobiales bacterium]
MSSPIAALPMYDWPEIRAETDALWARLRDRLRAAGVEAPETLARRNADLPAVPGGIRDAAGTVIAPDPATLPPDELDMAALWRHPSLLLAQTCWGPMETGLADHVQVLGQPSYDAFEGGEGPLYTSAIVMRRECGSPENVPPPADGLARLPLDRLRGPRFAYNNPDSMSGFLGISRDLMAGGQSLAIFSERIETGAHRSSILAIVEGRADVAAIDCRSWALARRFEPAAGEIRVVGWTARRPGLPWITARATPPGTVAVLRAVLAS